MNDAMSFGVHRLWKDSLMRSIAPGPTASLLDVAGGTGDISFRFLDYIQNIHGDSSNADVIVVDINQEMLDVGKQRLAGRQAGNIQFKHGNAEDLSEIIPDNSRDLYTIAFGTGFVLIGRD
jgi:2-methoxy-6-polyprenyl-1,4-benzoquinol methylase